MFNSELRSRRYEQNKTSKATVQDAPKHQGNTLQTDNQHDARHVMECRYDVRMHEDALEPKEKMMQMASSWVTKQATL